MAVSGCACTVLTKTRGAKLLFRSTVCVVAILTCGILFGHFLEGDYRYVPTMMAAKTGFLGRYVGVSDNFSDGARPSTQPTSRSAHLFQTAASKSPQLTTANPEGCVFPEVDPFDPAIKSHIKKHPPLDCSSGIPNLVYRTGDVLHVNYTKVEKLLKSLKLDTTAFKGCRYKVLSKRPGSDFKMDTGPPSDLFNQSVALKPEDEQIVAECYSKPNGTVLSRSYFSIVRLKNDTEKLLAENYYKHLSIHAPKETLSVLMIGMDGMSKQNFQRAMPKTRDFLLKNLHATELHKFNKVGLNTYPNVVPLLTGRDYTEFLEGPWRQSQKLDIINEAFLWSEYRRAGYRTALLLDDNYITAFHYQKKGWDKPPVDYYFRPIVVFSNGDRALMHNKSKHCIGDLPETSLFHDNWVQLASLFNNTQKKPYFGYSFSVRLTHDNQNLASAGDELYLAFLKELTEKNVLNNTLLIFFSDHGERFGGIMSTYNGLVESRTPFFFLAFPPWFHQKYPELMKTLKINQDRLTSHFDIHATLRDLLHFKAKTGKGDLNQRGISLFQEIPVERTCDDVSISTQFCGCNRLLNTSLDPNRVHFLAQIMVNKINGLTDKLRELCSKLTLKSVQSVMSVIPDHMSEADKQKKTEIYQLSIVTKPCDALYEGTIGLYRSTNTAKVMGDVNRLNMYRGQADCVEDPGKKLFCCCNNKA